MAEWNSETRQWWVDHHRQTVHDQSRSDEHRQNARDSLSRLFEDEWRDPELER